MLCSAGANLSREGCNKQSISVPRLKRLLLPSSTSSLMQRYQKKNGMISFLRQVNYHVKIILNKQITNNLNKHEVLYGSIWDELKKQKLNEFHAKKSSNVRLKRNFMPGSRSDLHLDCDSDVDSVDQDFNRDDGDESILSLNLM